MRTLPATAELPTSGPGFRTPTMERTIQLTRRIRKSKQSLLWAGVNGVVLSIILYDIIHTCPYYSTHIQFIEAVVALCLALNMIYHISSYIWNIVNIQPLPLTPEQKKLMGIKESDPYFRASTPVTTSSPSTTKTTPLLSTTPMNLSAVSWRSSSLLSSGMSDGYSPNYTMSTGSWEYYPGCPVGSLTPNGSPRKSQPGTVPLFDQTAFSNTSSVGFIEDDESLNQYLREYDTYEKSIGVVDDEQSSNILGSFWKNASMRVKPDLAAFLRRCNYQLAPPTPAQKPSSPGGPADEIGSATALQYKSQDVWRRVNVNPSVLTQWNSNLRMWLSQTVLERLVREMATVDEAFQKYGLTDMSIGGVGLDRLKKTAQIAQVVQNIPTLPRLVPFLEMTANQEYLAARIKELAKGGSMSEFRWNSGGTLHGKDWEEHLPTDSALVMYLFATYLDTQLPPMPHNPDRRPFTSEYLVRVPDRIPEGRNTPTIQEVQVNPPHYLVVVGQDRMDVGKGRNNFFHSVLLFVHQMNVREHGMVGRVNLGPSGVNLLWVIDS